VDPHVLGNHGAGADNDVKPVNPLNMSSKSYQEAYREYLRFRVSTGLDMTTDGATGFYQGWMAAMRHTHTETVASLTKSGKVGKVESEDGASRP
jgi:hypothetical protein